MKTAPHIALVIFLAFCGCVSRPTKRFDSAPDSTLYQRQRAAENRFDDEEADLATHYIREWTNFSLIRSLCEKASNGEISVEQIGEAYAQEFALTKLQALKSSRGPQQDTPSPPSFSPPQRIEQNVTILPPASSPFLEGATVGSQIAQNRARVRADQAASAAYLRQQEAYRSALEGQIRAQDEMFELGMQSKGWSRVTKAEADAWIQKLESARAIGIKEVPKLRSP